MMLKKIFVPGGNGFLGRRVVEKLKEKDFDFVSVSLRDGPLHEYVLAYGFAGKASWVQSWAYHKQYGFETINLIIPNLYGPGEHFDETRSHALGGLIMKFVEAKRKNKPEVVVWGTGKPVREWLYVDDGAEILIKSLEIEPTIEPINVGVGKGISILELAKLIKEAVGYEGKVVLDKSKPDGAPHKTMNNARLKEVFGWEPPTSLGEGVKKTVEWYITNREGAGGKDDTSI